VSPDDPGILRRRAGRGFTYISPAGRRITAERTLERIRAIVIPPAWTDVWICPDPNGHIQAVGNDARGRRQYRYHPAFRARRDRAKFDRLIRFGKALPRIRRQVRADLRRHGLPRPKVLAAVVRLLELTRLRVGNQEYARLNRSFGLSTLRERHATVSGATIHFRFRGKGGRAVERSFVDRGLAAVVRRCQDLPGQALFQYLDEAGEPQAISSEDVNAYLRDAAGSEEFSAKDFRTWTATLATFLAIRSAEAAQPGDRAPSKSTVDEAVRTAAADLGNTTAVTRASYVHPAVLRLPGDEDVRSRRPDTLPTRRDELALLAALRAAGATRSQAQKARLRQRPAGRAA
jgi:DNA topoisomerase-1